MERHLPKVFCWRWKIDFSFFSIIFQKDDPAVSPEEIIRFYDASYRSKKPPMQMGVEWERFGILSDTQKPVPYLGERGYEKIINGLREKYDWQAEDIDDGHIFTLLRGKTRITTEGDGKPEISGAPFESLFHIQEELVSIDQEIRTFADPMKIEWLPLGLQPFHPVSEIPLAPKNRYQTFLKMFAKNEAWMNRYMKAVCGFHINIDAFSAKDLIQKTQALHRLSPVLCGVFANSPLENGKPTGLLCTRRARVFNGTGMGRELLPGEENILSSTFSLEEWIMRFLEREMIILSREKGLLSLPRGTTFLDFLSDGICGESPTFADVDTHIKTHWVDIRPRIGYLEFRSLDALPLAEAMAVTAFIKGIMLSGEAMDAVKQLTKQWKEKDFPYIHEEAWKNGVKGEYMGVGFVDFIDNIMLLAENALMKSGVNDEMGTTETVLLEPLKRILETKITPAEMFLKERGFL